MAPWGRTAQSYHKHLHTFLPCLHLLRWPYRSWVSCLSFKLHRLLFPSSPSFLRFSCIAQQLSFFMHSCHRESHEASLLSLRHALGSHLGCLLPLTSVRYSSPHGGQLLRPSCELFLFSAQAAVSVHSVYAIAAGSRGGYRSKIRRREVACAGGAESSSPLSSCPGCGIPSVRSSSCVLSGPFFPSCFLEYVLCKKRLSAVLGFGEWKGITTEDVLYF